jgi:hypothetical protein
VFMGITYTEWYVNRLDWMDSVFNLLGKKERKRRRRKQRSHCCSPGT